MYFKWKMQISKGERMKYYIDYCGNCNELIDQEEIQEGVFGCPFCKSDTNISIIDVTNLVYQIEENEDNDE